MRNTRLLNASHIDSSQEVSDLWRTTTPDSVNISGTFSKKKFTAALQHLKSNKTSALIASAQSFIIHAGAALKSWLRDLLSSCLRRLKLSKIWRRALVVTIPKAQSSHDPKSLWRTQTTHKWDLAPSSNCQCSAITQTVDYVLIACPIHRAPHGARDLMVLDDKIQCWLNTTTTSI